MSCGSVFQFDIPELGSLLSKSLDHSNLDDKETTSFWVIHLEGGRVFYVKYYSYPKLSMSLSTEIRLIYITCQQKWIIE